MEAGNNARVLIAGICNGILSAKLCNSGSMGHLVGTVPKVLTSSSSSLAALFTLSIFGLNSSLTVARVDLPNRPGRSQW